MTSKAGVPVTIILIVSIIIVLSLAVSGFYLFQKERTKNIELQDQIDEISTKQRITETKLKESEKLISDFQVKLKDAQIQIDTLNNGLQQEKTARQEALSKIEQLRVDLEQQKGFRSDLENKLNQAQKDVRKTQAQLKELDSQKAELELKVKNLEKESENVELGKIQVVPEAAVAPAKGQAKRAQAPALAAAAVTQKKVSAPAVSGPEGKILVINKDYNFVVINLGARDGVDTGNTFSVYHINKYIGDVKVEKVHDSMAAAGLVSGDINKISEGDKILQKVK
jgi:FtsZ-interacting cell division protein ZipA